MGWAKTGQQIEDEHSDNKKYKSSRAPPRKTKKEQF